MKRATRIQGLDCAACAAKLETELKKIDGVNNVSIAFLTQRIVLEIEDGKAETTIREIKRICKKVEPDASIDL